MNILKLLLGLYFIFIIFFYLMLIYYVNYIWKNSIKGDSSPLIIKGVVIIATLITIISSIGILLLDW